MKLTLLLLAAAGLLAGLFFAFRPSAEEAPTLAPATAPPDVRPGTTGETVTIERARELRITVRGGEPVGGVQRFTLTQGEQVSVRVVSDAADEVHVHGYDLMRDVGPGKPATFILRATLTGRFEIELEDRGVPIAELEVRP